MSEERKQKVTKKTFVLTSPADGEMLDLNFMPKVLPIEGTSKLYAILRVLIDGVQHFQFPIEPGRIYPQLPVPSWMVTNKEYCFKFQFFLHLENDLDTTTPPDWEITRWIVTV